jgi:predicted regulator of Ras-like GTPase activity (Roadblock/LC7/MglB family)
MTHSNGTGAHAEAGRGRSARLDRILAELVGQVPEIEAASVVSFDGLPMASALPPGMDEDRVAAMSAALLSLGERAAEGLGRGELSQMYIEGENGNVFLVSADDEAVLVAVASRGAKVGMMLFEIRHAAKSLGAVLRVEHVEHVEHVDYVEHVEHLEDVEAEPQPELQPEPEAEQVADLIPMPSPEQLRPVAKGGWPEHVAEHARVVEHSSWADGRGSLPPVASASASTDVSNWS